MPPFSKVDLVYSLIIIEASLISEASTETITKE
jgi:hypothetical protein